MYRIVCTTIKHTKSLHRTHNNLSEKTFTTLQEAKAVANEKNQENAATHIWSVEQVWSISK
ncbi:hypothetical protein [Alkalicoccobacillus plakortidis]|uniref:Uncharacterized protein n=1 Tax=Alkalicoccobacillus plakortidis TaxID=444060 RepID=A0ABT0XRP6_9BACI|nr:hypothetical protein [Alkalicoccobacillus plakortidis]MCM2678043.1 hypothetical protein [Alkalicoccobacillus plakortidis]